MNVKLPRIINNYINASNAYDVKSILSCFSDDAVENTFDVDVDHVLPILDALDSPVRFLLGS